MKHIFLISLVAHISGVTTVKEKPPTLENHHKMLLISMDGLSYEYYERLEKFESFKFMADFGTKAKFVRPPFLTMTSPCHTTLVTGLYVENHNVVHNCYYDWRKNETVTDTFYTTLPINEWWDNGYENIWITAANQGLKSGGYLFPGSNATVSGKSATRSILETLETPFEESDWRRIDDVMLWFTDDAFDFVALYFEEPDLVGHKYGPYDAHLDNDVFPVLARTMSYLLTKMEEFGLRDDLNIILASDHGMYPIDLDIPRDEVIETMKYLKDPSLLSFQFNYGPLGLYEPAAGKKEEVYEKLKGGTTHMKVYYKEDLPDRYHYKNTDRLPSIVAIAEPGFAIYDRFTEHEVAGEHGYDNQLDEMNTVFYAIGPSFKANYLHEGFDSIHVYSLMCYLLGLRPAPNNGSLDVTMGMLKGGTISGARASYFIYVFLFTTIINHWYF